MSAFEKIIGYEDIKKELLMLGDILKNPEKYEKLGVRKTRGLLLFGCPGVGKSTMAEEFIQYVGWDKYSCRKSKPDGDFVKEIAGIFNQAKKNTPCIIYLDDLDKYANARSDDSKAEEYVTVQSCMDEVKDIDIFIVATANNKRVLPESLLRPGRFDNVIKVEAPEGKESERIVEHYLSKKNYVTDVDSKLIARLLNGHSCATLESVINLAGIYAGYKGKEAINMDDIIKAYMRFEYEIPDSSASDNPEIIRNIATHEAGHAVLSEILVPGSLNIVSVKGEKGEIGGFTADTLPDIYWYSKKEMENRVIGILGGKAATDLLQGTIDPGVTGDLHRAFDIVERFVDDYCGFGFNHWIQNVDNPAVAERRDSYIAAEMSRYYEEAKRLLAENMEFLKATRDLLIKEKVVTGDKVRQLREQIKICA